MNRFVSIGQAAVCIGVSRSTLRRWEKAGYFKPSWRQKETIGGMILRMSDRHFINTILMKCGKKWLDVREYQAGIRPMT